jgi:O-antigen/teichoic acid export membrane protein
MSTGHPKAAADHCEDDRRAASWDVDAGPKNYIATLGTQAVGSVLALASAWLGVRLLGPSGYGGVAALFAASQCAGSVLVSWSAVSVVRFGCGEFVSTGRITSTFWNRLALLSANLVVVLGLSPWWLPAIGGWLHLPPRLSWLVLLHLCVTAFWSHVQSALQAAKLPRVQGALQALERVVTLVCLGGLALAAIPSVFTVALVYILAPVLPCGIALFRIRRLLGAPGGIDRSVLSRLVRFSMPLVPYVLVSYLSTNYLDAFFISHFLSVRELGIYTATYQVAGTAMQIPGLAGSLLLPFFVTLQETRLDQGVARYLREFLPLFTLLWSVACTILALAASIIVPLMFGHDFRAAAVLIWPLLAAAALAGPIHMGYAPVSSARSATYIPAIAGLVAGCTNVALDYILIPRFGLAGCAWATTGAYAACAVTAAQLVSWRIPESRSWSLLAASPALLAAALAVSLSRPFMAVICALVASVALAAIHRHRLESSARALWARKGFQWREERC